jgi:hypothetical protein
VRDEPIFDTPRGPAGFDVADICHADDCDEKIHREMRQLCGIRPGAAGDAGCGWWFCPAHLFPARTGMFAVSRAWLCGPCWDAQYGPDPNAPVFRPRLR